MEALQEIDIRSPQLDYFIANQNTAKDAPNGRQDPAIVQQFIDRYNYGHVGHKEKLDEYLNDQPIQKVLEVYRLDPEKFWYFMSFCAPVLIRRKRMLFKIDTENQVRKGLLLG